MKQRLDYKKANPAAMDALMGLERRIANSGLEKPLTELVRLRASQINGCAFCVDMHDADARKGGESDRRLANLAVWREAPFYSDRERAALGWTEALTLIAETHAPEEEWRQVEENFTPEEIVDLTLLISTINAWNRFAISFRMSPS